MDGQGGHRACKFTNALLLLYLNLVVCKNFSYISMTTIRHMVSQDTHLFSINCTPNGITTQNQKFTNLKSILNFHTANPMGPLST